MEYYSNRLCISMRELVDGGIMSESNYKQLASRGRIDVVRRGGGATGCYALVALDSLPQRFLDKVDLSMMSPFNQWAKANYVLNQQALLFYLDYNLCGKKLKSRDAITFAVNASLLDLLFGIKNNHNVFNRVFGGKINWDIISEFLKTNQSNYGHTLPLSRTRLLERLRMYQRFGLSALISRKYGNQNARKKI